MKIYLDVCCINQPFDDLTEDRIRLEAEAILTILNKVEKSEIDIIGSDAIDFEIRPIPDLERKNRVTEITKLISESSSIKPSIETRAREIQEFSFAAIDALHIAFAEQSEAEALLTTDDGIINAYTKNKERIKVKIRNPIEWLMEMMK